MSYDLTSPPAAELPWHMNPEWLAFGNAGPEFHGLDYESARDATPRWYGVSFGNGNDGVSQMFPDYYCRTSDPYHLAAVAMLANFNNATAADKTRINDATQVDGEADYCISATIYNPEDIEEEEESAPDYESLCVDAGFNVIEHTNAKFVWVKVGELGDSHYFDDEESAWQDCAESNDLIPEEEESGSYCDANGAWMICEVFPVDPMPAAFVVDRGECSLVEYNPYGKPAYCSLEDCFGLDDLVISADRDSPYYKPPE